MTFCYVAPVFETMCAAFTAAFCLRTGGGEKTHPGGGAAFAARFAACPGLPVCMTSQTSAYLQTACFTNKRGESVSGVWKGRPLRTESRARSTRPASSALWAKQSQQKAHYKQNHGPDRNGDKCVKADGDHCEQIADNGDDHQHKADGFPLP